MAWGSDKSRVRVFESLPFGKSVQLFYSNINVQNKIMPALFSRWTTTASTTSGKSRNENPTCTFTATRHKPTRPNVHVNIQLFYISFIYCIEHGGLGHTLGAFFSPYHPSVLDSCLFSWLPKFWWISMMWISQHFAQSNCKLINSGLIGLFFV